MSIVAPKHGERRTGFFGALSLTIVVGSLAVLLAAPSARAASKPPRDLFVELLGKSDAEISAKLEAGFKQLYYGRDDDQRLYYPVGADMAYIADIGSEDVRTEGMSYGMMIAVQMDRREEFDRLWRWAKTYMYHPDGVRRGYFAWSCRYDGTQNDPGSACDGEEWFTMALFFASHRWGDRDGMFNYGAEAQALLREMLHKPRAGGIGPMFDLPHHQVVFAPTEGASQFTDPSYHLPAFYELWARWAADKDDRGFWRAATFESRAHFRHAANPTTGLMPDISNFNGTPHAYGGREDFRFDAWRTPANVAVDFAWWHADGAEVAESNRLLRFLATLAPNIPNQMTLDGKSLSHDTSSGMLAMAAVAGLAADPKLAQPFVQRLWGMPIPSGHWRYYDGVLYQLALLEVSGHFRIYEPPAATTPKN